jgi:hypothetical protein
LLPNSLGRRWIGWYESNPGKGKSSAFRTKWVVPVRAGTAIPEFQDRCLKPLGHPSVFGCQRLSRGVRPGKTSIPPGTGSSPGVKCRDPAFVYSTECESQQARTQQHQAGRGQCEESVGDNVVVAHDTPTTPDARPNLLKLSKFPIGTTESFAQLEFGRTPEPLAVQAHALER